MNKDLNVYPPSAYHDPREVIYKHIIAQAYWSIIGDLQNNNLDISDFKSHRIQFIKFFNSQQDLEKVCNSAIRATNALLELPAVKTTPLLTQKINRLVDETKHRINQIMMLLSEIRHVDNAQGYVADGLIEMSGRSMKEFALTPDYIKACLMLMDEDTDTNLKAAKKSWVNGFACTEDFEAEIHKLVYTNPSATDLITEVLFQEQKNGEYESLQAYEYDINKSDAHNNIAKSRAINEGFYLMGKLMAAISLMNKNSKLIAVNKIHSMCPVHALLSQAGINASNCQMDVIREIMLVRCTHGLSPGEFAARIAASVRPTFPRALINSFMVRTGRQHGGALTYCMDQQDAFINDTNKTKFVETLIISGKLTGFGHRIHKLKKINTDVVEGADPRVRFMLDRICIAFPEKKELIDELELFARIVQRMKPTLSPNTDFAAGALFHCLGVTAETGLGLFVAGRLPGLISEIIRQLDYKSNSIRPPLPVIIPYRL